MVSPLLPANRRREPLYSHKLLDELLVEKRATGFFNESKLDEEGFHNDTLGRTVSQKSSGFELMLVPNLQTEDAPAVEEEQDKTTTQNEQEQQKGVEITKNPQGNTFSRMPTKQSEDNSFSRLPSYDKQFSKSDDIVGGEEDDEDDDITLPVVKKLREMTKEV